MYKELNMSLYLYAVVLWFELILAGSSTATLVHKTVTSQNCLCIFEHDSTFRVLDIETWHRRYDGGAAPYVMMAALPQTLWRRRCPKRYDGGAAQTLWWRRCPRRYDGGAAPDVMMAALPQTLWWRRCPIHSEWERQGTRYNSVQSDFPFSRFCFSLIINSHYCSLVPNLYCGIFNETCFSQNG